MLESSYLPDVSEKWDTNWARNSLKISEDQLSKLKSIPEWLPIANSTKESTISKEISSGELQKEPLLQSVAVPKILNKDNSVEKKDICSKGKKLMKKRAHMDSDFDISISYSQPEMGSYKSTPIFPKPLEKLDDHILSHKYLKESTTIFKKPEKEVLCSSQTEVPKGSESLEETSARLDLSEKNSVIACDAATKPTDEKESGIKNSNEASGGGSKEVNAVIGENQSGKPEVESNEEVSNSKICTTANVVEDSFRCESIPCGQPVKEVIDPSPSPVDPTGDDATKQEKEETGTVCRSSDKDKGLPSSPHSIGSSSNKRKRKSKGDTPKRLKDAKRPKNLNIHFTSDQVKNMLKILRLSHS